jgi:hypothetical protein
VRALEIFCYGTWGDYHRPDTNNDKQSPLPPLTPAQAKKLRQATAVSLASAAPLASARALPYGQLMPALGIDTESALEDFLVADCIYAGLLRGRLDGVGRVLAVEGLSSPSSSGAAAAAARDVPRSAVPGVVAALSSWLERVRAVEAALEGRLAFLQDAGAGVAARRAEQARRVERAKQVLRDEAAARRAQAQQLSDLDAAAAAAAGLVAAGDEGGGGTYAIDPEALASMDPATLQGIQAALMGGGGVGGGGGGGGGVWEDGDGSGGGGGGGGAGGPHEGGGGGGGGGGGSGGGGAFGAVRPKRRR